MEHLPFKPGPDIVAVKHVVEKARSSGIIVEVANKQKYPARGIVVALGENMSVDMKVGDLIMYNMAVEENVEVDDFTFDLALGQNVLGVFPDTMK